MRGEAQSQHKKWLETYGALIVHGSNEYGEAILKAKDVFFAKLGRSDENSRELYDGMSETFLEWFLFDYELDRSGTTVASRYIAAGGLHQKLIRLAQQNVWSVFKVKKVKGNEIHLKDLLNKAVYKVFLDFSTEASAYWFFKRGQIIQARLFPNEDKKTFFLNQAWFHPYSETKIVKKLCGKMRKNGSDTEAFLVSSFEVAVRSERVKEHRNVEDMNKYLYSEIWDKYCEA